jgi:hypothetical protein
MSINTFVDQNIIEMAPEVNDEPAGVDGLALDQELDGFFEAFVVAHHEQVPVELLLIQAGVQSLGGCVVPYAIP